MKPFKLIKKISFLNFLNFLSLLFVCPVLIFGSGIIQAEFSSICGNAKGERGIIELRDFLEREPELINLNLLELGDTGLIRASRFNNIEAVKFLVNNGADLTKKNFVEQDALEVAISYNYKEIEIFLKKKIRRQADKDFFYIAGKIAIVVFTCLVIIYDFCQPDTDVVD